MDIKEIRKKLNNREVGTVMRHRYFSVLIPLIKRNDGVYVLFEQRAAKLKKSAQPGDICFPGGKIEQGEGKLEAALRETSEEIGICSEKISVIGQFDTVHGYSGYSIYTFVGEIKEEDLGSMKINTEEVEDTLLVPLDFFLNAKPYVFTADIAEDVEGFPYELYGVSPDYYWGKSSVEMPLYKYENHNIWGITARIIRKLANELKG